MSLAAQYREAFLTAPNLETVADWLDLLRDIDPDAIMSTRDLGVYIEFSDGSLWLLGSAEDSASRMRS
jgi:hypothetical protein